MMDSPRKDDFVFSTVLSLEKMYFEVLSTTFFYLPTHYKSYSREMQAKFAAERGWKSFATPRNLLLGLVGEVGKVSEIL